MSYSSLMFHGDYSARTEYRMCVVSVCVCLFTKRLKMHTSNPHVGMYIIIFFSEYGYGSTLLPFAVYFNNPLFY